jgi:putative SOS response-associated peptidase YedK
MCGRLAVKATWAELVALYRLTMDPAHNLRPRYNVCPTDPVDVVTGENCVRQMRTEGSEIRTAPFPQQLPAAWRCRQRYAGPRCG